MSTRNFSNTLITIANQLVRVLAMLVITAILARRLPATDFGLISIVTVIGNFAALICNMGFSAYTIQKEDADNVDYSVGFVLNMLLGALVCLVVFSLAPLFSKWWGDPRLVSVLRISSVVFFIGALGMQSRSLLEKQLKFRVLLYSELSAVMLSVLVAVGILMAGGGYWAIVSLTLCRSTFLSLGYMICAKWLPSMALRRDRFRQAIKFGVNVGLHNWANFFARNIDKVLIGNSFGVAALGYYENAYKFMLFPVSNLRQPVTRVLLPTLSKSKEDEQFRSNYLLVHKFLSFLVTPGMLFLAVNADQVIGLLLGPNWGETARIFSILAFVGMIQPLVTSTGTVMLSLGESARYLKWGLYYAFLSVAAILVGLKFGVIGVAVSYAIFNWASAVFFVNYSYVGSPLRNGDFWGVLGRAAIFCVPAAVLNYVCVKIFGSNLISLVWALVIWAITWAGMVISDREYRVYLNKGLMKIKERNRL